MNDGFLYLKHLIVAMFFFILTAGDAAWEQAFCRNLMTFFLVSFSLEFVKKLDFGGMLNQEGE